MRVAMFMALTVIACKPIKHYDTQLVVCSKFGGDYYRMQMTAEDCVKAVTAIYAQHDIKDGFSTIFCEGIKK